MPYKPKKPCAHPGCPKLTASRFCPEHTVEDRQEYTRYRRDPQTRRRYGREWRRIRNWYISLNPMCERCAAAGRITPAREVHHIIPLSEGGTHDVENLMSLCKSCHSGITLAENNSRGR